MLVSDFIRLYPQLFHMAADGAWPSIERHGLLSTNALLDLWEIGTARRADLLGAPRGSSSTIEHPELGRAVIRDQKAIHVESLANALRDEMSVADWLELLNSRAFFFVQPERMLGLLNARSYQGRPHTVITVDTAQLVADYESRIELCRINSGFARPHSKASRGRGTFQSIAEYQHISREVARSKPTWDVSELCVVGGVPNIVDYVARVDRMQNDHILEQIA